MGEDLGPARERACADAGCHLAADAEGPTHDCALYAEGTAVDPHHRDLLASIVGPERERLAATADDPTHTRRFRLFGYLDSPAVDELVAVLERAGAECGLALLPDVDVELLRCARPAALQIIQPNAGYEEVHRVIVEPLAPRSLYLAAPYGLAASVDWLHAVGDALGLRDEVCREQQRAWAALAPRWQALRERIRGQRLGFVVDARQVEQRFGETPRLGTPLLAPLVEMGFGIDILCHAIDGDLGYAAPLRAAAGGSGDIALHPFADPAELDALLRRVPSRALYSDYFYDDRISRAGKAQFNLWFYGPGPGGALRSFERLAHLCALPFYRRYGALIGREGSAS